MSFSERLQKDFTTITLALIPVAVVINIVVGQIVATLKLPIYVDSIGTILVGALCGPLPGAITGAISNILWAYITGQIQTAPFALTAFVIGLCAGFFASKGVFKNIAWTIAAGLATGVIAALVSAPILVYVNGGVTGTGTDAIVTFFQATGANLIQAATIQGFISDPIDKTISYLIVWVILRGMSKRLISQFPRSQNILTEESQVEGTS